MTFSFIKEGEIFNNFSNTNIGIENYFKRHECWYLLYLLSKNISKSFIAKHIIPYQDIYLNMKRLRKTQEDIEKNDSYYKIVTHM